MKVFIPRFAATILLLALLTAGGTLGYVLIQGWSVPDALYMSVITITAVGYQEVHPLSVAGRHFTMALLLAGITWMGLWFALITSLIVELDLTNVLRRRRVMREINKLEDHFIICGAGRTGRQVIHELDAMKAPWVVIEKEPSRVEKVLATVPNAYAMEGDATHDQTLLDAGLERAKGLITCLSADTDNLFVCLSARDLSPELVIVARAYEEETMDKLYRAGATHVVSPNVSGAIRMASMLLRPSVVSFLDVATRSSEMALRMEGSTIGPKSPVAGKTLAEARIPHRTGLIVIALRKERAGGDFLFNPVADTQLEPGDELIVLGRQEQIDDLDAYVQGR